MRLHCSVLLCWYQGEWPPHLHLESLDALWEIDSPELGRGPSSSAGGKALHCLRLRGHPGQSGQQGGTWTGPRADTSADNILCPPWDARETGIRWWLQLPQAERATTRKEKWILKPGTLLGTFTVFPDVNFTTSREVGRTVSLCSQLYVAYHFFYLFNKTMTFHFSVSTKIFPWWKHQAQTFWNQIIQFLYKLFCGKEKHKKGIH